LAVSSIYENGMKNLAKGGRIVKNAKFGVKGSSVLLSTGMIHFKKA